MTDTSTTDSAAATRASNPAVHTPPAACPAGAPGDLRAVLRERFRFAEFRAHQEQVCRAVAAGQDTLLVMPTGSGKSLCYQLPGVARGGTTLVVSPLIALMKDQTAKLRALGLAAAEVHSGRTREESREACRAYLRGELDFLAVAPERLSVPGFPEMLARRPPCLVAIDEAHCISHWGHDFRPDYRLLGERLPLLRPAPVVALTATATVRVQDDILEQLAMSGAARFIRGFRRPNLAVEMLECTSGSRLGHLRAALAPPERRPAIVYVPTRRAAEETAAALSSLCATAAYHAGLDAERRSRAQEAFLGGATQVVVATIAFGMGIDKPDVRTVIHAGMPGSLEAYYQEIGRAGRDGLPARAILLWGWSDRRLHEHFLERDFPEPAVLESVMRAIPEAGIERETLLARSPVAADVTEVALDKLWIHGGAVVDAVDRVTRGGRAWRSSYEAIRAHRAAQIETMTDLARARTGCRMVRLIRHFGDEADDRACGVCDVCAPRAAVLARCRALSDGERRLAALIAERVRQSPGRPTGALHREMFAGDGVDRAAFEECVDALVRAGALAERDERLDKDGRTIRYRRVFPGRAIGGAVDLEALVVLSCGEAPAAPRGEPTGGARGRARSRLVQPDRAGGASHAPDAATVERLRAWRRQQAAATRVPAFRVMTDRTMLAIAAARPSSLAELMRVPGVGPLTAARWGERILSMVAR
jgi:DNA topoisomerase-3